MSGTPSLKASGEERRLIVQPDVIDLRDRFYTPTLAPLQQVLIPKAEDLFIRNQRDEGACTAFALAAVIDRQCNHAGLPGAVSTRMLFEMAKLHDDLPDHTTAGSTLRGALKGFFHNGVCGEDKAPYTLAPGAPPWQLDIDTARHARSLSLGAYFRLNHEINDYHAAINETGGIIASAKVHSGWASPQDGRIARSLRMEGRHAFAIVGYTGEGFLIQNSWGGNWGGYEGLKGVALWSYDDWFENVEDAWVLRLAVSAPAAFDIKFARSHAMFRDPKAAGKSQPPRRQDINGHFLHLDDGALVTRGSYAQTEGAIEITAGLIRKGTRDLKNEAPYKHLLIFAHGALSGRTEIARRIKAWREVFKANGIYPIHIMWETGFNSDIIDVMRDLLFKTRKRMGAGADHLDAALEQLARPLGRKLWRDLKTSARLTFAPQTDGGRAIRSLIRAARTEPELKLHFASISAGVFLLAELADALEEGALIETASLLAPACGLDHYDARIRPHAGGAIRSITQYSLIDRRELADTVDVYQKSLLYLVANALECGGDNVLLGMEKGLDAFGQKGRAPLPPEHRVFFAGRDRAHTDSTSHRGFERDPKTMNSLIETITGQKPPAGHGFSDALLSGY